jgi:hypothetical protein
MTLLLKGNKRNEYKEDERYREIKHIVNATKSMLGTIKQRISRG